MLIPIRSVAGVTLVLGALWGLPALAQPPLTLGLIPIERPEVLAGQWRPMLEHIEQTLGVTIRMDFSDNYAEVQRKYQSGRLDLVYAGPLFYTELRQHDAHTTPVVHFKEKNGSASYTCSIFSTGHARVRDLKGKRIAVMQPLSTCGYLMMEHLFKQDGASLAQTRFRYFQQHDVAALAVAQGQFDAAGVKTSIGQKYAHLGLHAIVESPPLPGLALVANGRSVPAELIERLKALLTHTSEAQRAAWGDNLRHGAVEAFDRDYDAVRAMKLRTRIPDQDTDR